MKKHELKAILQAEINSASGYDDSEISTERERATQYYLGEPFGNEIEGRSQVVSRDVADTIESMLPDLVEMFTASDRIVQFVPDGPEDELPAKQESDIVNHIFYKENDGFLTLYSFFKDALLHKTGVIKTYWDDTKEVRREEYKSLELDQLIMLSEEDGIEIIEAEKRPEKIMTDDGLPVEVEVYDVAIKRTIGGTCVVAVPPEEFLISRRHDSINPKSADFCAHRVKKTVTELRLDGVDEKVIERLSFHDEEDITGEKVARFEEEESYAGDGDSMDESMREVWVNECYIRIDYDGDGIAELRKITLCGNEILDNEEIDVMPFSAITPVIMTHKFHGRSIYDLVKDIQEIKSTFLRQILDNLYLLNNQRTAVVEGQVNLDDLLTSRPGGIVRMKQPGMAEPLRTTPFTGHAYSMLEQLDSVKENRTGVTKYNQGMDANSLNKTFGGMQEIMAQSMKRLKLIGRIFAETGVKHLMLDIHRVEQQYQKRSKTIKIHGKWTPVNPSEWHSRQNMTVHVGLGTGNKMDMAQKAITLLEMQKGVAQAMPGMVSPQNVYKALENFVEASGYKGVENYFTPPEMMQAPPPQPDPIQMQLQAQSQIEQMKVQAKAMESKQKFEADMHLHSIKQQKDARDYELAIMEANRRTEIDKYRIDTESELKIAEMSLKKELELMKQELELLKIESDDANEDRKIQIQEREREINESMQERQFELESMRQVMEKEVGMFNPEQQTNDQIIGAIEELKQTISAPRKIVKDENGRPVGVEINGEVRGVIKDESGNPIGIE